MTGVLMLAAALAAPVTDAPFETRDSCVRIVHLYAAGWRRNALAAN